MTPFTASKETLDASPVADVLVPVEVYLVLEHLVERFDGIGAGRMYRDDEKEVPNCLLGFCSYATNNDFTEILTLLKEGEATAAGREPVPNELSTQVLLNDRAVRRINRRKGVEPDDTPVTWDEYTAERRWVPAVK